MIRKLEWQDSQYAVASSDVGVILVSETATQTVYYIPTNMQFVRSTKSVVTFRNASLVRTDWERAYI